MDGQGVESTAGCARAGSASRKEEAAMDTYLRAQGLFRKRIAKDGSCLFRAVAEKVLHSQLHHLEIRKSCINYLRENRDLYEAFIEGSFEEYLKRLENPQEWVGQVEISALSLMFKRDFIIYQEPNVPPAYVTENGFSEKILLCFSNGNHYDIIYPIAFAEGAALCQSIVYELLYEKVLGVNVIKEVLTTEASDVLVEDVYASGGSGSELEDDSAGGTNKTFADMNGFKSHKDSKQKKNGDPIVPRNVVRSLEPAIYRNVEYEVWLKSQRDQQKLDFSIAAGMQYSVGDKCEVRLEPNGKFYNAHIQEVGTENGPVVVFVEELGMKHTVQLKNLKPLPLTFNNTEGWNTVAGKKIKKSNTSGLNTPDGREYKGQKSTGKTTKQQVASPRLQQAAGNKPGPSLHSADQANQSENKGRSKTPPKVPGRKLERERIEDSKRDSVHFGLTPEERREKQVIEESKSLYEMQNRDVEAFPALSSSSVDQAATKTTEMFPIKTIPPVNTERSTRRKSEGEDQRAKASKLAPPEKVQEVKKAEEVTKELATSETPDLHEIPVLPIPPEHQTPTTVPSDAPHAPNWSGIAVPASQGAGSDSSLLQPQVSSATFTPLPVSMPAVNQPILPLPQTLSLYQDPLFPGFPFNEKGDRANTPAYSFCKSGEDLPNDQNILRFFFNLGVKAYTYPTWPPHTYLYPLHQAYLNMCRMYPNIPVCPQSHWVQDQSVQQNEVQMEGFCSQAPAVSSPTSAIPPVQAPGIVEPISQQSELDVNNQTQPSSGDFEEPMANKTLFPQSTFGQGSYMGTVQIAPPFVPHFWYTYNPYQGYIDNSIVRHNVYMPPQDRDESENPLFGSDVENRSIEGTIKPSLDSLGELKPDLFPISVVATSSESGSKISSVKKEEQLLPSDAEQVPVETQNLPVKMDNQKTPLVDPQAKSNQIGCAKPEFKDSSEKEIDSVVTGTVQINPSEGRVLRAREESSEDEREVSNMLSSGRSKNYYNQTYGLRRPSNERLYPNRRGAYYHGRGEEGWRGQRGREDGYQPHRNFRGRPYRRRPMGDMYRAHHD
ncbi:OTU domain-containing protein 4 [Discoglossus pictus]